MLRDGLAPAEVAEQLGARIDALARQLLPAGHYGPGRRQWRCGSVRGEAGQSLCVWLDGSRRGRWKDYSAEETQRGDALDLVAAVACKGDLGGAIRWALDWLGLGRLDAETTTRLKRQAEAARDRRRREAELEHIRHA